MEPTFEVLPPGARGPTAPKPKAKGLAGAAMVALVALAKFKFILLASLKTSLSMVISIGIYSMIFGWKFAAGFVLLILVHEMGHVLAALWLKFPVTAPLFIPFVGAAISMKENPRDAWTEALLAYGGPLAGCLGGWACWALAGHLELPWLMAVASTTFFLNLFNLVPVPPLDGGRICAAVSPWFWIIGLILFGLAVFSFHAFGMVFIIAIVLFSALPRIKATLFGPRTPEMERYYATPWYLRFFMAALYLGLIAILLYGFWDANRMLYPDRYQ